MREFFVVVVVNTESLELSQGKYYDSIVFHRSRRSRVEQTMMIWVMRSSRRLDLVMMIIK